MTVASDIADLDELVASTSLAFEVKAVDKKQRTIEGYASTPHIDDGDDIVEPGACKFRDASDVMVFVGHKHNELPIGVPIEASYDDQGRLFTKTRIHKTHAGDDLLAVASERSDMGMPIGISIGYPPSSVKARFERKDGRLVRHIDSLDLVEYSFVAAPMNDHARVTAVKAKRQLGGRKAAADMSDEDRRNEIQEAINARTRSPLAVAPAAYTYVVATFDDRVIVCDGDGDYWQIPYAINAEGEAELGTPIEVEQTWTAKESGEGKAESWSAVDKTELPKSAFAYAPDSTRSDWKLPHHNPDGSVNAEGVRAALAALAGARTGKPMDLPSAVREHLEAHEKALASEDGKSAARSLATKAGRVLSDANLSHLQGIHDAAHSMGRSAGHDLHGHGMQEHDHLPGDDVATPTKSRDFGFDAQLLELLAQEAALTTAGRAI